MRQRLCLAHTLVHDPQLLILDEPASGLDPRARVEMREILRELRGMGKTILVSSHILPELAELCTSVGIIDRGRLLRAGSLARSSAPSAPPRCCASTCSATSRRSTRSSTGWEPMRRVMSVQRATAAEGRPTRLEVGFDGDAGEQAALLAALVAEGHRVSGFAQATSDLEELFLQVTGHDEEAA